MPNKTNHSIWRDRHWSDISNQLHRLNTIDATHFDSSSLLLRKDTTNGAWLQSWLGRVYNQHSTTARETATVQVIAPGGGAVGGVWALSLEVVVRRHQSTSFATFPAAFDTVAPAPSSSSSEIQTSSASDGDKGL